MVYNKFKVLDSIGGMRYHDHIAITRPLILILKAYNMHGFFKQANNYIMKQGLIDK